MRDARDMTRRRACKVLAVTLAAAVCAPYARPLEASAAKKTTAKKAAKPLKYYAIVYNLNGGANKSGQTLKVQEGKTIAVSKLKKPKLKGNDFVGWYADATLATRAKKVYGEKSAKRRTLYAKWEPSTYQISYELGDGSPTWAELPTSYRFGDAFRIPEPMKAGSVFLGWYRDEFFTTKMKRVRETSTGDRELYALWLETAYWENVATEKIAQVERLRDEAGEGRGDAFVFVTDMHLPNNALVSPQLIRRIRKETGIDKVVFGGDALNGNTTAEEALAMLRFLKEQLSGGTTWYVRGNHDSNDQQELDDPTWALTDAQYREALFGDADYLPEEGFYYYRDNEDAKVRYLVLDTGHGSDSKMDDGQVAWLQEKVLELDGGWTALVIQHKFFNGSRVERNVATLNRNANGTLTQNALDALYDEAREKGIAIAGVLCGHCHRDYSSVSEKGYPIVATTCDAGGSSASAYDLGHPNRYRGTCSEVAFDVVVLNTEKRRIDLVRFGVGQDRSFSY